MQSFNNIVFIIQSNRFTSFLL
nr:unnamed protein product [Callosobruchus chinensis]